ncbi:MAG: bifunctional folylpolyglutamate synthase/dihydrofolate synthase [Candidatus Paraimprobicoccus trichonymphae]|uniref:tetrahydrofolate synthase n=1 Tax=Candidatus Paraimprobicoccus trichonymphae TaxID=3033793 RepID=A0AA48I5W5_9FIRM|nr:MAG: bifunctional folylpolyglutamate synthase/dihydrofolate synthase [Candidatus Paraimprobicoccus trichonymphae]
MVLDINLRLDRIKKLLHLLGDPQNKLKIIHVAGTNGKGSVCNMLASILVAQGFKTGLYSSPEVVNFRDRIQINFKMIKKKKYTEYSKICLESAKILRSFGTCVTEFEFITAVAFKYFFDEKVNFVVLETGLGGRLDATNVFKKSLVSIITSISLDHTKILGNTLEKIAREKSGIIKKNCPTIIYPLQSESVFNILYEKAKRLNSKVYLPNMSRLCLKNSSLYKGSEFKYENLDIKLPLLGEHQIYNLATALCAIEVLRKNFKISDFAIKEGLHKVNLRARFEVISLNPTIILDGAHNPSGAYTLKKCIKKYLPDKQLFGIVGMMKDKDVFKVFEILLSLFSKIITVEPKNKSNRALSLEEITKISKKFVENTESEENLEIALYKLITESEKIKNSAIIIFGSLYLAKEFLSIFSD